MLITTFKMSCGTKMKHGVFENMLLFKECGFQYYCSFLTRARISWARYMAKVQEVCHRHSWFCRHSNVFVILVHKKIHYSYDSITTKAMIETKSTLWKVGKQVFRSLQREYSWLLQCKQIHQQRWISQYQSLGIILLSGIYKSFLCSLQSFQLQTEWRQITKQHL